MDIKLHKELPGITMEPSMMFAYPTAAMDLYTPAVEQIYLPEAHLPPIKFDITVKTGHTGPRQSGSLKWKTYRALSRLTKGTKTVDFSGQFVVDGRKDTDKNISHLLELTCSPVLYAQQLLSEHLNQDVKIHVLLNQRASEMARQVYGTLGIPIICTDDDVYGHIVEFSFERWEYKLHHIHHQIFDIDIKDYNPNTPERVFIPRRGNRSLSNTEEVQQFLEERGFTTYYFEDLTPSEEWSIARNAKVAVVVHGAGSANFTFNRVGLNSPDQRGSGLRMIELFSPSYTLCGYRHFSTTINARWCAVRGQITPEIQRFLDFDKTPRDSLKSPIKDPFKIDLQSLQMALDYMDVTDGDNNLKTVKQVALSRS